MTGDLAKDSEPMGSMLGSCRGMSDTRMTMVQARPASEFDATARIAKDKHDVAGVGEKAVMTENGLFVQPPGKPYFLHIMVMDTKTMKHDEAQASSLAKIALENAK